MANTLAKPRSAWSLVTPMLLFSCFCLLVGDMLFGYDTASFGGILANPGFIMQFGNVHNAQNDAYSFDATHTSLISSLAFLGKFIGCLLAGTGIEMFGHRIVFFSLSIISFIGIIVEITAAGTSSGSGRFAQFIIGRIIVYISIGLVEVDVTTYQSEIVPAAFRGFVVVSLQLFLNCGTLLATGINRALSTRTDSTGWRTITGVQFVFPCLIILFTFFIPSSPRWLLSKNREDEAIASLRRLRPQADVDNGNCEAEIGAIKEALQEQVRKGPWWDVVRGHNLRRTAIVIVFYFFQQVTGQAFVSTYQTVFYKNNGYADHAFTYPMINAALQLLAVIAGMYLVDKIGRRWSLMISFCFQAFWMFMLAGLGRISNRSGTEQNAIVASFMLYAFFYNLAGASVPYLLGSEIPNAALRERTQALGTSWNVLWAFATNFSIPYLIADLTFGVGWAFGGLAVLALVFTFFFLPETKGLALEEIDAVFATVYNPFRPTALQYSDAERHVGELEGNKRVAASTISDNVDDKVHEGKSGVSYT